MFAWWGARVVAAAAPGADRCRISFVLIGVLWGTTVFGSLVSGGFNDAGRQRPGCRRDRQPARPRLGRRRGALPQPGCDGRRPRLPAGRPGGDPPSCPPGRVIAVRTYWDDPHARVRQQRQAQPRTPPWPVTDNTSAIAFVRVPAIAGRRPAVPATPSRSAATTPSPATSTSGLARTSAGPRACRCRCCWCCCWSSSVGLVAAGLPLVVGGLTVLGSFAALRLLDPASPTSRCSPSTSSRSSAWAWRSTTGCSSSAGSARSCAPASPSPTRSAGRWPPPGGPCCSLRSPWPCRCPA